MGEGEDRYTIIDHTIERWRTLCQNARYYSPEKAVPFWSKSDVEEFVASDPVHGAIFKATKEADIFAGSGIVIGAVSSAIVAWKYSKSPHGAVMAFGAGGFLGCTFGMEVANHWLQLYWLENKMASTHKFLDWWWNKSHGRS